MTVLSESQDRIHHFVSPEVSLAVTKASDGPLLSPAAFLGALACPMAHRRHRWATPCANRTLVPGEKEKVSPAPESMSGHLRSSSSSVPILLCGFRQVMPPLWASASALEQ